jgi:hypothetical protein
MGALKLASEFLDKCGTMRFSPLLGYSLSGTAMVDQKMFGRKCPALCGIEYQTRARFRWSTGNFSLSHGWPAKILDRIGSSGHICILHATGIIPLECMEEFLNGSRFNSLDTAFFSFTSILASDGHHLTGKDRLLSLRAD